MFKLFKKFRRQEPVSPPAPLPEKPKQYILDSFTKGIREGIYFLVYQNESCSSYMCFGTNKEFAIYDEKANCTLVVPVDRKTVLSDKEYTSINHSLPERDYIPRTKETKVGRCSLTEITAGEIAGFLWKQLEEENKACEEYYSGYLGCPHRILFGDERPTLWYKTNLETVLLESSENLKN